MNVHFGAAKVLIGNFYNPETGKPDKEGEALKNNIKSMLKKDHKFKEDLKKLPDGTKILLTRENVYLLNYTVIFPEETEAVYSISTGYISENPLKKIVSTAIDIARKYRSLNRDYKYKDEVSIEERPEINYASYEVDEQKRTIKIKNGD